jgi:isopenicillin N synthase-like dioxygenase
MDILIRSCPSPRAKVGLRQGDLQQSISVRASPTQVFGGYRCLSLEMEPFRCSLPLLQYKKEVSNFSREVYSRFTTMATAAVERSVTQNEARQAAQAYLDSRLINGHNKELNRPFTIPEINIAASFSTSLADRKKIAAQIHDACTNSGFFHITGHGIPEETRQNILALAKRFFKTVPREKKEALHVKHSKYFRGWEPAEYTYVNPSDWDAEGSVPETKEGFNWAYEDGLDPTGGDGKYLELDGGTENGNVWPDESDVPGFYETVREYYGQILTLARHLFRLFALSLNLEEDHFDEMMTHPGGIARLLYYPQSKDPQPLDHGPRDKEIGLGAHSDYECFTILLCSSASGLEILSPDNVWVPAPAVEGSFIINVADFLMRWTNGVYRSTVHRVVNRTREERYSVPFFFSVNYDQVVEVSLFSRILVCAFELTGWRRCRVVIRRTTHPSIHRFGLASIFWRDYGRLQRTAELYL